MLGQLVGGPVSAARGRHRRWAVGGNGACSVTDPHLFLQRDATERTTTLMVSTNTGAMGFGRVVAECLWKAPKESLVFSLKLVLSFFCMVSRLFSHPIFFDKKDVVLGTCLTPTLGNLFLRNTLEHV